VVAHLRSRTSRVLLVLAAIAMVAAGCRHLPSHGHARPSDGPCGTATAAPKTYEHVVWIWMENHRRDAVIGNADAPFLTDLAQRCGTATDYRAVGAPSLPNYLGATSGDTHGITNDGAPSVHPLTVDNLFRQVRDAGGTVRTYAEAMPSPCALVGSGRYAAKHNPAAYYVGGTDRDACASEDLPLGTATSGPLADDIDDGKLPAFTFVIPDLCNDTHDCSVATGDTWLRDWITRLTSGPDYHDGTTAIFVVWDEPTPMPFLAVAPSVAAGSETGMAVDHYALLRTTEEMLGLPTTLGAASSASSLRPLLHL
jgi:hypothetical protein